MMTPPHARRGARPRARSLLVGTAFVASLLSAALFAACSDTPAPGADAGVDTSAPPLPTADTAPPPPPKDAEVDAAEAGRDPCDERGTDGLVTSLACTGLYADFATKKLAPGVVPYQTGAPFWTDGAEKERYLQLPPGTTIDTGVMDAWKWPVGTKVWKQFKVGGKRIETRYYGKVSSTKWQRTTYRWDAGETRAMRLDTGETLADGYEIPTLQKCDTCHYGGADQLLGLDAVALSLPGATGVTLASLAAAGALSAPPATRTAVVPEDATGKASAALQWLHANCSSCHSDAPLAAASAVNLRLALRPNELLTATPTPVADLAITTTAYCTQTRYVPGDAGGPLKNIEGGDKTRSAIWVRASVRDAAGREQMPPIGSHKVDAAGVAVLGAWLDALRPCP